jgi:hypothetical protein
MSKARARQLADWDARQALNDRSDSLFSGWTLKRPRARSE